MDIILLINIKSIIITIFGGIDVKISEGFGENKVNEIFQILKIEKDKDPEIIDIPNKNYKK